MEAELVQINMYATASVPFWCSNFTWQLQRSSLQEPEDSTFRILLRDILSNVCVFLFLATASFPGPHASVRTQVHWPFIIQACRTWTSIFLSHNILVPWLCVVSLRAINRITVSGIVLFNGPIKVSIVLIPLQFTMKYIVKAVDLSLNIDLQKKEHGHASNDKKFM